MELNWDRKSVCRRSLAFIVLVSVATLLLKHPTVAQEGAQQVLRGQAEAPVTDADVPSSILPSNDIFTGDLDGIRERTRIRILVPFSKTFYFIDRGGAQAGATYEMGKEFGAWLKKQEKAKGRGISVVFVPTRRDELFSGLVEGRGDIAAGNLTITDKRSEIVDFAHPLATGAREILVTAPNAPAISSLDDLVGQEIFARPSSSYYEHLKAMNVQRAAAGKPEFTLTAIDEDLEDEDILEMVNADLLPWGVVDEHKAKIWAHAFDKIKLRPDIVIHEGGEIAWAIRKNSPQLKSVVDKFADTHKFGTTFGNILKNKYAKGLAPVKAATSKEERKKFEQLLGIFRGYGHEYKFDALMIAAQGYQESKLNQNARSHRGAVGIMQLLPSTAADPAINIKGIDKDAAKNIQAGVKYLRLLTEKYLNDPALDDKNRTLMAFAAYNAGPGNLRKFRKLAERSGLDPNLWFGNVEHAAAKIVGRETVDYVAHIYVYYVAYRLATERLQEQNLAKENLKAPAPPSTWP